MKWVTILLVAVGCIVLQNLQPAFCAGTKQNIVIKNISHSLTSEGREVVLFELSAPVAPKVFSIPGENPRVVVDFPNAEFKGSKVTIPSGAQLARGIRVGFHQEPAPKVRVAIDLNATLPVNYEQELLTGKATFTLLLFSKTAPNATIKTKKPVVPPPEQPAKAVMPTVVEVKTKAPENDKKSPKPEALPAVAAPKPEVQPQAPPAPGKALPYLRDITFEGVSERGEMVYFYLNEFYPPSVSAIETENPGVLCQFKNMTMANTLKNTIAANGKFVKQIHVENDATMKTIKVKLDLAAGRNYDLQQVFFKNNNLFVLVVNELAAKKTKGK